MSTKLYDDEIDVNKFTKLALHYSDNAKEYLKKDFQKASEMVWGAMLCTIKAVATKKNELINSHNKLFKYASKLAKEQNDKNVYYSLLQASLLHKNFYESNLDPSIILESAKNIFKTIDKLMYKIKNTKKETSPIEYATCPNCNTNAESKQEIENKFGYRTVAGISKSHSWCKNCRNKQK